MRINQEYKIVMECSGPRQEISPFTFNPGAVVEFNESGGSRSQGVSIVHMIESPLGGKDSDVVSKTLSKRIIANPSTETLLLRHNDDHATCFNEVVRRIESSKQIVILGKISGVTRDQLSNIVKCCKNPTHILSHHRSFFTSDEFPYVNLRAFRDGVIDVNEFSTLASVYGIFKENSEKVESFVMKYKPLFDQNGEPDKDAWEAIEETLQKSNDAIKSVFYYDIKDVIKKMQAALKAARPLEAGFWHYDMAEPGRKLTIADATRMLGSWALSGYANQEMIPSITMMQALLDSAFGEEAHRINPVIGSSTVNDIRLGGVGCYRDYAIPFPGIPLPKSADGFPAPTIAVFQRHDKYHLERASLLTNADKDLYIAMGDALQAQQNRYNDSLLALKLLYRKKEVFIRRVKACINRLPKARKKESMIKFQKELHKISKLAAYLRRARKGTGQLKFAMYDLDFHLSDHNHKLHRQQSEFIYHFNNIIRKLNSKRAEPLNGVPARLAGRAVLPFISDGLDNPSQTYAKLCSDFGVRNPLCWLKQVDESIIVTAQRNTEFIDSLRFK